MKWTFQNFNHQSKLNKFRVNYYKNPKLPPRGSIFSFYSSTWPQAKLIFVSLHVEKIRRFPEKFPIYPPVLLLRLIPIVALDKKRGSRLKEKVTRVQEMREKVTAKGYQLPGPTLRILFRAKKRAC